MTEETLIKPLEARVTNQDYALGYRTEECPLPEPRKLVVIGLSGGDELFEEHKGLIPVSRGQRPGGRYRNRASRFTGKR